MHFAAGFHYGPAKTLEILIQKGAKLDAKDNIGQTPIHLAVLEMRLSRIEMLARYGSSLKIRNLDGFTPLECALKDFTEPYLKCSKVLLYRGMKMFTFPDL